MITQLELVPYQPTSKPTYHHFGFDFDKHGKLISDCDYYWFNYGPYYYPTPEEEHELMMAKLFAKADADMAALMVDAKLYMAENAKMWFGEDHPDPEIAKLVDQRVAARKKLQEEEEEEARIQELRLKAIENGMELAESLVELADSSIPTHVPSPATHKSGSTHSSWDDSASHTTHSAAHSSHSHTCSSDSGSSGGGCD